MNINVIRTNGHTKERKDRKTETKNQPTKPSQTNQTTNLNIVLILNAF